MKSLCTLENIFSKYQKHPDFDAIKIKSLDQKSIDDDTMLHIAARTGAIKDVEVLICNGADINAIGDLGNTPLHQAAMFGESKSVLILLKYKAKTTIRNEFNQIPADVAKISGHIDIERMLINQHPIFSYPPSRKRKNK